MNKTLKFQNTFFDLGESFYHENKPSFVPTPELILWNEELAKDLDIELSKNEIKNIFSGNEKVQSSKTISTVYSGHQFGHFSPRLGDGRAHLLGELKNKKDGKLYDVQLKGSGRNLFSRSGDGRSAIGPVIREYILSEAMHALGVPTTRALCALSSGDFVYREEKLPGGILTRVSEGLIRVGHFEYFSSIGDVKSLKKLLDYSVNRFYPELKNSSNKALDFLKAVSKVQAKLIAQWMSYGFIHGVMNTDNSSVLGLTIDYGPCAFMDETNFNKVFSYIDQNGRYSYNNQPRIGQWNLAELAEALLLLFETDDEKKEILPLFEEVVTEFKSEYEKIYQKLMLQKIGFNKESEARLSLLKNWLKILNEKEIDFTMGFRDLAKILINEKSDYLVEGKKVKEFKELWVKELEKLSIDKLQIAKNMNLVNPLYIPRNHKVEEVIKLAEEKNYSLFYEMVEALKKPFEEKGEKHSYALPPKIGERVKNTFCGT